jgi:intracellular multiplication protein IcmV
LPATGKAETFDEAVARFNLTEADLKEREKDYLFYAGIFLVLGLVSFVFGFYLLFVKRKFLDCLLGIAVAALFGTQGFRYHFWYFLIKQRKLGCTFDDWLVFIKWNKPVAHK